MTSNFTGICTDPSFDRPTSRFQEPLVRELNRVELLQTVFGWLGIEEHYKTGFDGLEAMHARNCSWLSTSTLFFQRFTEQSEPQPHLAFYRGDRLMRKI